MNEEIAKTRHMLYELNSSTCYSTDNNFAYALDLYNEDQSPESIERLDIWDIKYTNFVPTYDKWCIQCNNKAAKMRCSRCKAVYFCDKICQTKAWRIHKKHCGRNLFSRCIACGNHIESYLKCDNCPVKFCSESCKEQIYSMHKIYDCDYFSKTFNSLY
jgi:hypothetical protein